MTDEELKKAAELLNDQTKYKCLRHQFKLKIRYCRLCDAKRQTKGNAELARKIYIQNGTY